MSIDVIKRLWRSKIRDINFCINGFFEYLFWMVLYDAFYSKSPYNLFTGEVEYIYTALQERFAVLA